MLKPATILSAALLTATAAQAGYYDMQQQQWQERQNAIARQQQMYEREIRQEQLERRIDKLEQEKPDCFTRAIPNSNGLVTSHCY